MIIGQKNPARSRYGSTGRVYFQKARLGVSGGGSSGLVQARDCLLALARK